MKRKIHRCFLAMMLSFALLLVHLGSIISDQTILAVGHQQNTRTTSIVFGRGTIYDRHGTPLTNANHQYKGVLVPEFNQLSLLQNDMSQEEYERLKTEIETQSLLIANLYKASYAGQKMRTFQLPKRYGQTVPCVHLLGYLNEDGTGQTGIEKSYNTLLEQHSGSLAVSYQVNGIGACQTNQTLKFANTLDNCQGGVQLSIDANVQALLDDLMPRYITKGAAIILSPDTGEILACTSLPTFHPEQIQKSIEEENGALVNRILSRYDCGSIFKIITAAAALEQNISANQVYSCNGEITIGNTTFHCHQRLGHNALNMDEAFAQSCNLYFIQLAQQIGGEAILNTAAALGLYKSIDLADEISAPEAVLPNLTELVPAALANLSFGQGKLLVTPLHVAQLTATIANDGKQTRPSAVLGTIDSQGNQIPSEKERGKTVLSPTTTAQLQWMMEQVVSRGTGAKADLETTTIAGKTGTAQTGQYNEGKPVIQSWFTGYFPAENPQYVITILAEDAENNGGDTQGLFRALADKLHYTP